MKPATGRTVYKFSSPIEVVGLQAGGPAERAGIRKSDRIITIDGNPVGSIKGSEAFSNLRAGKAMKFTILRSDGSKVTLNVVPAPRDVKESNN